MIEKETVSMDVSEKKIPQKSYFAFSEPKEHKIFFNSQFDSGNMNKVTRQSYDHYRIWTASDCQGTQYEGYPKSWFYFRTGGFINRRVTFSIHRVHFLWMMSKKHHLYRPVYRTCSKYEQEGQEIISQWDRLPHPVISIFVDDNQELVLKFDFTFKKPIEWVQFAFIYPYGYEQCRKDVLKLKQQFQNDSEIYFKQYQLGKSVEGRTLDLLMISSHQGKEGNQNIKTDQFFTLGGQKLTKFRSNKPVIFISARVHPIETPSSYCLKGIIQFLVNKKDFRAHLLRKYFVFAIVPMLNPDGVANGHCRMDTYNQNLNRYYKTPDPKKQPSCYAVKLLAEHFNKQKRIFMYLDLHAHPAHKGNFMFGNAIFDYVNHVQSNLFPKIISNNCINFEFEQCNFSRKHMKAKDRFEDMNKQGCGRVVFYREFGVNHAYTLQCGYHCNLQNNQLSQAKNIENVYRVKFKLNAKNQKIYETQEKKVKDPTADYEEQGYDYFKYYEDLLDDSKSTYYNREITMYTQQTYKNLGKNILISLLDIWNRNPYTRIEEINDQRKQIAEKHSKLDRFKKQQAGIKTKKKQIVELIQSEFYGKWHKRNVMSNHTQSNEQKIGTRLQFLSKSNRLANKKDQKSTLSSERMIVNTISKGPIISEQSAPKQTMVQSTKIDVSISKFDSSKGKGTFVMKGNVSQSRITLKSQNKGLRPLMNLRIKSFINYK